MDPCENPKIYRNRESITSKWRDMGKQITRFYCIMTQLQNQSGTDTIDLVDTALRQYKVEYNSDFTFFSCWNLCRVNPKWEDIVRLNKWDKAPVRGTSSQSSGSKRARAEDSLRPPGRDSSRNARARATRGEASVEVNRVQPDFDKYQEIQLKKLELEQKKLAIIEKREKRIALQKKKTEWLTILSYKDADFEGADRARLRKLKRTALKKLEILNLEDEEEDEDEAGAEDEAEYDDDDE